MNRSITFSQLKNIWILLLRKTSTKSFSRLYIAKIILTISSSFRLMRYVDFKNREVVGRTE